MRFFGSECRDHVAGTDPQYARQIERQCEHALGGRTSIIWGFAVALMFCGCGSNAVGDSNSPDSAVGSVVGNPDSAVGSVVGESNSPDSAVGSVVGDSNSLDSAVGSVVGDSNSLDSAVGSVAGDSNSPDSAVGNAVGDSDGPDSAVAVFCDLRDGRRIPAGAAYADVDGCNCCVCRSDGSPVCQGAGCIGNGDAGVGPASCQSDQDCPICVFNSGCTSPRGNCMAGNGICPIFAVSDAISYCGCDGVTYSLQDWKQYPYLPYSHVGACP